MQVNAHVENNEFNPERHFARRTSSGALKIASGGVARLLTPGCNVRTCVARGSDVNDSIAGVSACALGVERLVVFVFAAVVLQRVQLAIDERTPRGSLSRSCVLAEAVLATVY